MADEDAATTPEQEREQGAPDQPQPEQTPQDRASREGPKPEPQRGEQGAIRVDADWKAEAKAEKQRLARETEQATAGPGAGAAGAGRPGRLPAPSLAALVQTLATQAIIFLSNETDPETGRSLRNLDLAKHNIDLLGVLEEKTRGNLSDEEKRLLDRYLYELRMAYVAAAS